MPAERRCPSIVPLPFVSEQDMFLITLSVRSLILIFASSGCQGRRNDVKASLLRRGYLFYRIYYLEILY
jgi:hypothetical protein